MALKYIYRLFSVSAKVEGPDREYPVPGWETRLL